MSWPEIPNMMMDTAVAVFGVACEFRPKAGGTHAFQGIFDNKFQVVNPSSGMEIASTAPAVSMKLSDLPVTPKRDDVIRVSGKDYLVKELKPDGQGGAVAVLYEE